MKRYSGIIFILVGVIIVAGAVAYGAYKGENPVSAIQSAVTGSQAEAANKTAETTKPKTAQASEEPTNSDSPMTLVDYIDVDHTYATVDGKEIKGIAVLNAVRNLPSEVLKQNIQNPALIKVIVDQLVNNELLSQAAEKENLGESEAVQSQLEVIKDQLARDAYIRQIVSEQVTDETLRTRFEELLFNTPRQQEVRARHILVETEDEAKDLIDQISNGGDFVELAKEHSIGPSAARGGELGYFTKDMMVKPFAEAAFSLEAPGLVSQPVKTEFGYHVVEVLDQRLQPKPEFEDVRDTLRAQVAEKILRDKIAELGKEVNVERDIPNLDVAE